MGLEADECHLCQPCAHACPLCSAGPCVCACMLLASRFLIKLTGSPGRGQGRKRAGLASGTLAAAEPPRLAARPGHPSCLVLPTGPVSLHHHCCLTLRTG